MAIITVTFGIAMLGPGVTESARLRRSAVLIASAVKVAYSHANASSHVVRLVFNFEQRTVGIEESEGQLWLAKNDRTGGAQAATEAERKAVEESDAILKGPRAPRPAFKPATVFGFSTKKEKPVKELERSIGFLQIETAHEDEPVVKDQAYLYFWPGGQTERAAIQLSAGRSMFDADVITILISPLTGKAEIRKGKVSMARPRDDAEESERVDTGF